MRLGRGFLPLAFFMCFAATSCGDAPSIDLKNAPVPLPGSNNEKPSKPGTGGDAGNTTPDNAEVPGGTPRPTATPVPAPREPDRLACTASTTGTLITFTSMIGSDGFGREISLIELGPNGPAPSEVVREDANVYYLKSPVIARSLDIERVQVLMIGTRTDQTGHSSPKLYSAIANVSYRIGIVTPVGPVISMNGEAVALAAKANLQLRSHGVSLQGRYLLVPTSQGTLNVLNSDTLAKVGELPVDPRTSFYPQLDEASGTLAVLRYQSGALAPAFYRVSLKSGKVAPSGGALTVSASSGTVSSPPVLAGSEWVWGEQSSGEQGRIRIGSYAAKGLGGENEKSGLTRVSFAPPEAGVRVSPQVAPVLRDGQVVVAVAYERVTRASSGRVPYKVEVAKLGLVSVSGSKSSVLASFDYPPEVTAYLSKAGLEGKPLAVSALLGASDLKSIYVSLPTLYGYRAFRLKEFGLDAVSQETCFHLSVQQAK